MRSAEVGRGWEVSLVTSLGFVVDAKWCGSLPACLTDKEWVHLSKDKIVLSMDSGKAHHTSLTATSKKRTHVSCTSCPPSTIVGPNAPGEDVPPLCGPLIHHQGRPCEACN